MPRGARKESASGIYHIMIRGINKQKIFEEEADMRYFIEVLKTIKELSEMKLYAYCLMNNHVHILLQTGKEDLSHIMRRLGARYCLWYNIKYERSGHLFQDRYKSEAVEDDKYFLAVLRYILRNPVKAGMVEHPKSYFWSSYREFINKNTLTDIDFVLKMFNDNKTKAIKSFVEFIDQGKTSEVKLTYNRTRRNDKEARRIITAVLGKTHPHELGTMPRQERDYLLRQIKEKGLSARQIAGFTGIGRSIIERA